MAKALNMLRLSMPNEALSLSEVYCGITIFLKFLANHKVYLIIVVMQTLSENDIDEITVYLNKGLESPEDEYRLSNIVYSNLKSIAINRLASEWREGSLCATALVHEAVIKSCELPSITWQDRKHFYRAMAEAMRRIIIDRARYHGRYKREGEKVVMPLDENLIITDICAISLTRLDEALDCLELQCEELALLIKLKFYAGLTTAEIAELYNQSARTIDRKLLAARAWLLSELEDV